MDTTAASELGMREPVAGMDGAGFWDVGTPGLGQWGDNGGNDSVDDNLSRDSRTSWWWRCESGFPANFSFWIRKRRSCSVPEPPQKLFLTVSGENGGLSHCIIYGNDQGSEHLGRGTRRGRGTAVGAVQANFDAVGSLPS